MSTIKVQGTSCQSPKRSGGKSANYSNQSWSKFEALRIQKQHIEHALTKQNDQTRSEYKVQLNASTNCVRFLLRE